MAREGLTVERLTQAAAELADEVGFDHVTVSALARRFGVKDANLYAHIRSVQDLKTRVAVLALAELADRVATELAGRAGKDALVAFANAYRDYAKAHPGRYAATQLRLDAEDAAAGASARHAQLTRATLRAYKLPEPDETDALRLLHSAIYGYVNLEALAMADTFNRHPRDLDASWARALDALDTLLTGWPTSPGRSDRSGDDGSEDDRTP